MKRVSVLLAALLAACAAAGEPSEPRPGDIIFQTSRSSQSQAIQLATHSRYSHMGLILQHAGNLEVLEAAGQVRFTPLVEWIGRGEGEHYVIKRLKDPSRLSDPGGLARLEKAALQFAGRPYDLYFEWSDDRIYCSELVWKTYERGLGIHLGDLARLGSFDLSNGAVKAKMAERFGDRVPLDENVISPAAIFDSPLLVTVK